MSEPDDKLGRAWRELAREEPPASLDAAVLAAARRAVARPSLARRWGVPVSLAAMLVLAIGVTLEMQHEQPGVEVAPPVETRPPTPMGTPTPQRRKLQAPEANRVEETTPSVARPMERPRATSAPQMMKKRQDQFAPAPEAAAPAIASSTQGVGANTQNAPAVPPAKIEAPRAANVAPLPAETRQAPPPAEAELRQAPQPERAQPPASPGAQGRILSAPEPQAAKRAAGVGALQDLVQPLADPRAELKRIAKLRAEGRDEEADRALEQFRRRHPDYRIDDAMWKRVKPR